MHGIFHHQHRILAQQANEHHQRNLRIDVVFQSTHFQKQERAQDAHRQEDNHRHGQQEVFVLRSQDEIHKHQAHHKDNNRRVALFGFVFRDTCPVVVIALGQCALCHLFDGAQSLTARITRCLRSRHLRRVVEIVARDFAHAISARQRHKVGIRHHLSVLVFRVEPHQVFGEIAILRSRLHNHLIGFAKSDEARLIVRPHQNRQIFQSLSRLHTFLQSRIVVHVEHKLRITSGIEREGIAYLRTLAEFFHKILAHALHLVIVILPRLVEQAEFKTTRRTVAWDGRRFEKLDVGLREGLALLLQIADNLLGGALAVLPVFEVDQATAGVGTRTFREDFKACQRRHTLHTLFFLGNLQKSLCSSVRALYRGARRRFHHGINHPLVFLRNEACRQTQVHPVGESAACQYRSEGQSLHPHRAAHHALIALATAVETSVEALQSLAHKTQFHVVFLLFGQNQGAQSRCQGQCHKGREQDARCHGDGELAVEHTLRPSHKRHGDEHRSHHQRNGNDGTAYLLHRLLRGFHRREFVAQHLHIHRFNHHNGVVHHNTDGHHQGEERNHVERDVEYHHRNETSQQRDGDG